MTRLCGTANIAVNLAQPGRDEFPTAQDLQSAGTFHTHLVEARALGEQVLGHSVDRRDAGGARPQLPVSPPGWPKRIGLEQLLQHGQLPGLLLF